LQLQVMILNEAHKTAFPVRRAPPFLLHASGSIKLLRFA
jgi:hypothetical protein